MIQKKHSDAHIQMATLAPWGTQNHGGHPHVVSSSLCCGFFKGKLEILQKNGLTLWSSNMACWKWTLEMPVIFRSLFQPPFSSGTFQPAMFDDTRGYLHHLQFLGFSSKQNKWYFAGAKRKVVRVDPDDIPGPFPIESGYSHRGVLVRSWSIIPSRYSYIPYKAKRYLSYKSTSQTSWGPFLHTISMTSWCYDSNPWYSHEMHILWPKMVCLLASPVFPLI